MHLKYIMLFTLKILFILILRNFEFFFKIPWHPPPPLPSPPPKHQNKNVCKYFYKIFMLRLWWSYNKLLFSHHYCIRTSLRIIVDKTTSLGANIFKWKSFCFYFYFILINSIMSNYFILTLDTLMWEVIVFMRQKIILHIN